LEEDYGTDRLVCIYWHIGDSWEFAGATARKNLYGISAYPTAEFDAVEEVVGAGSTVINTYRPIILDRMAIASPVTITSHGYVGEGGGTVTAKFKADASISYTNLRAQFVVIEESSPVYPWTAREVASPANITLSAPGDSVVVTRDFTVPFVPGGDLQVVVFLENTSGPWEVLQAHLMPDPYAVAQASMEYASEIDALGTASYAATVTNMGTATDTITVDIAQEELPDGVSSTDWEASYREVGGSWLTGPMQYILNAGESMDFEIQMVDNIGTATGMCLTTFTSTSGGNPTRSASSSFATFVETPSILLVADDMGWGNESHWETALDNIGYSALTWVADDRGRPSFEVLSSFWAVLWTTANGNAFAFTGQDETEVADYLDAGGNLYLASMNFLSSRAGMTSLISDYLHISSWTDDVGDLYASGVPGDAISDGMELHLVYGVPPTSADAFTTTAPAEVNFTGTAGNFGLKIVQGTSKLVFHTFPFESVSFFEDDAPNNRDTLLDRVLTWFAGDVGVEDGVVHKLDIEHVAPNPFNPMTKIAFTVPENAGRVTLTIHNVNGQVVRSLVDAELEAGPAVARWDGRNDAGRGLATGIYFAKLSAAGNDAFAKMTLLK
jgi:hypothetical protein